MMVKSLATASTSTLTIGPYIHSHNRFSPSGSFAGLSHAFPGPARRRLAASFHTRKKAGFRIIARNRTHRHGEIDLIAIENEFLVFVEVHFTHAKGIS